MTEEHLSKAKKTLAIDPGVPLTLKQIELSYRALFTAYNGVGPKMTELNLAKGLLTAHVEIGGLNEVDQATQNKPESSVLPDKLVYDVVFEDETSMTEGKDLNELTENVQDLFEDELEGRRFCLSIDNGEGKVMKIKNQKTLNTVLENHGYDKLKHKLLVTVVQEKPKAFATPEEPKPVLVQQPEPQAIVPTMPALASRTHENIAEYASVTLPAFVSALAKTNQLTVSERTIRYERKEVQFKGTLWKGQALEGEFFKDGHHFRVLFYQDIVVKVVQTYSVGSVNVFTNNAANNWCGPSTYYDVDGTIRNYMSNDAGKTIGEKTITATPGSAFYSKSGQNVNATNPDWEKFTTPLP